MEHQDDDYSHMMPENTLHLALVQAKVSHANIKSEPQDATAKDVKGKRAPHANGLPNEKQPDAGIVHPE